MEKILQITRISQRNGKMAANKTTIFFFIPAKKVNTPVRLKSLQRQKGL